MSNKKVTVKTKPVVKKIVAKAPTRSLSLGTKEWIMLGCLALAIFLVYQPALGKEFINYDDDFYITNHPLIKDFKFSNIPKIFSEFFGAQYSPLPTILYGLINMNSGFDPFLYNLTSILLHIIASLLVFSLIWTLCKKFNVALITAALFGLATMQVESVAWLAASYKTGLYSIFFLASLIMYIRYARSRKTPEILLSLLFFIASCFCKEQAVALPLAIITLDIYLKRKVLSTQVILEKIPFFIISLIFGYITMKATGSNKEILITTSFTVGDRIIYACYALCSYLYKLIVPLKLSLYYPYPSLKNAKAIFYLFPFILTAVIGLYIWAIKKKQTFILWGGLFFIVNILFSLALQIISVREVVMADRYVYLASIGFFFILAFGADKLVEQKKLTYPVIAGVFGIYLLVISVVTFNRVKVWKDTLSITSDVLSKYKSPLMSLNRGYWYKQNKQYEKAISDYNDAILTNPNYALAYQNRGTVYFILNNDSLAFKDFSKSLELDSLKPEVWSNRGALYARQGKTDLAIKDFTRALELNPQLKDALNNRSLIYYQIKEFKKAIADLDVYLKMYPDAADNYNLRALCKAELEEYQGALADYALAIKYKPNDPINYQNRSFTYYKMGDKQNALKDILKAKELGLTPNPEYLNALNQ